MNETLLAQVDKEFETHKLYCGKCHLDGVIDADEFSAAPHKILWILKEPNDGKANQAVTDSYGFRNWMRDTLEKHIFTLPWKERRWKRTYWPPLCISYALLHGLKDYRAVMLADKQAIASTIHRIAWINVKKSGGASSSNIKEIHEYYALTRGLLARQIQAIAPEIIFNCTLLLYPPLPLEGDLHNGFIRHQAKVAHLGHPARKGYQSYVDEALKTIGQ